MSHMKRGDIVREHDGVYRLVVGNDTQLRYVRLSPPSVKGKGDMCRGTQGQVYTATPHKYTVVGNLADIDWEHLP